MESLKRFALALIIIGAINWGLIGLFNFDFVATIFGGEQSVLTRIIYILVGLSGLYALTLFFTGLTSPLERNLNVRNPDFRTEFGSDFDELDEFTKKRNRDDTEGF